MSAITRFLPRKLLSRVAGIIVHWRGPRPLVQWMILVFAHAYKINLKEMEHSLGSFSSLGDFFVRSLKPSARDLGDFWFVHCADSVITQCGDIQSGQLIQAKGVSYPLTELCQDPESYQKFKNGGFATYYLCPTDYHRVHSPMNAEISRVQYIPGDLWPVNSWSTENVKNIFCQNERIYMELTSEMGILGLVLVGATNVGYLEVTFDASLRGNHGEPARDKRYSPTVKIDKGEEVGRFRMGSTVILLMDEKLKINLNNKYLAKHAGRSPGPMDKDFFDEIYKQQTRVKANLF